MEENPEYIDILEAITLLVRNRFRQPDIATLVPAASAAAATSTVIQARM